MSEISCTSIRFFLRGAVFTTFCHQKVAPKVSAGHLRRDRTAVLTERAQKTALLRRKRLHRFDCGGSAKSARGLCTRLLPVVLHTRSGRSNRRPICFLLRCNAEIIVRCAQLRLFVCVRTWQASGLPTRWVPVFRIKLKPILSSVSAVRKEERFFPFGCRRW